MRKAGSYILAAALGASVSLGILCPWRYSFPVAAGHLHKVDHWTGRAEILLGNVWCPATKADPKPASPFADILDPPAK